jgi:EAL domain-containing protein (putative c-di-GMP-specific phosphodiesterase class I)
MAERAPINTQAIAPADERLEENLLLAQVERLRHQRGGYFSIHLHLSALKPVNRQAHFIDIAARSFEQLIASQDCMLFRLSNLDIVLLCNGVPIDDIDPVIDKVRGLFSEDPLTAAEAGSFDDRFTTWYDLSNEEDYVAFYDIARDLAAAAEARREQLAKNVKQQQQEGKPLTPAELAVVSRRIMQIPLSDMIRDQVAVKVVPGSRAEVVFREFYVGVSDLRDKIAPDFNLVSNAWLFQYLTEGLDRRVIAQMVQKDLAAMAEPVSLNLNIQSVLGRDFQMFTKHIGDNARRVIVELQVVDIFSDMPAYMVACETLRSHGFRVLVDGLNPLAIQFFDPATLNPDFIKVAWGPEFAGDDQAQRESEMREIVEHAGRERVIISRVDSEEAVKWGFSLGVSHFQGFFIDRLVRAMSAQIRPRRL